MRLLVIGDIIGRTGRAAVSTHLPGLIENLKLDFVIANGENAAAGFGLTRGTADELFATGIDCITTGNHWLDQKEILTFIDGDDRILRPANYPRGTPGRGGGLFQARNGAQILVLNLIGWVFMDPIGDPFACVMDALEACPLGEGADAVAIDFHAEATSEKMAFGQYCDGRASLVVGTHTHVPTADAQILPHGTGYITDLGGTCDYDSVIGMDKDEPVQRFARKMPGGRFAPASGEATLCGVFAEIGADGLCARIEPVRIGGRLKQAVPEL